MAARFEIHLDGEANISLPAERALLKFAVTNTSDEKSEAAKAVVSTARQVENLLIENSKVSSLRDAPSRLYADCGPVCRDRPLDENLNDGD